MLLQQWGALWAVVQGTKSPPCQGEPGAGDFTNNVATFIVSAGTRAGGVVHDHLAIYV